MLKVRTTALPATSAGELRRLSIRKMKLFNQKTERIQLKSHQGCPADVGCFCTLFLRSFSSASICSDLSRFTNCSSSLVRFPDEMSHLWRAAAV